MFGKNPETPMITKPTALTPAQKADETEVELYKFALWEYVEQSCKQKQDIKKMYAVILGQCTDAMMNKLKALDEYDEINDEANCTKLHREIRKITYLSDKKEDLFMSAVMRKGPREASYADVVRGKRKDGSNHSMDASILL